MENQKTALTRTLAEIKLSEESFDLSKDRILFYLESMRGMDMDDLDSRKRLVKTFVNAIYLFDDKLTLVFNYTDSRENPEIIELSDIANGVPEKFVYRSQCSTTKLGKSLRITVDFGNKVDGDFIFTRSCFLV